MNTVEERAKEMLATALVEVRSERRASGQLLHGWRREAALRAIERALTLSRCRPKASR